MNKKEKINQDLKKKLSAFRYEHSLMTAEVAKELATHYQYDQEKAYLAGLVHDIAKEFTKEENEIWIKKGNLSQELLKEEFRNIIHADVGAVYVKEQYQLDDDICSAVKYHTIGNVSMDLLSKIIFVADKIGRKNLLNELQEVKKLAYQNLDKAIEKYWLYQKEQLELRGEKLHPDSIEFLESINYSNKS